MSKKKRAELLAPFLTFEEPEELMRADELARLESRLLRSVYQQEDLERLDGLYKEARYKRKDYPLL